MRSPTACSAWCTWSCARTSWRRPTSSAALRLAPTDPDINHNYGWFLCQTGREDESIKYFMQAVRNPLYPTPWRSYSAAGLCSLRKDNLKEAEEFFQRALRLEPDDPTALLQLGQIRYRQGNLEEARKLVLRYNKIVEPTAESLWLALRVERKLGERVAEASYANQLRRRFATRASTSCCSAGSMTEQIDAGPDAGVGATASARSWPGRARRSASRIADVAQQLKFAARQIEALEQERFEQLPPGTFARGMVRSYARLLKLDAEPLVQRIAGRVAVPDNATAVAAARRPIPITDSARRSNLVYAALSLAILGVIAAVLFEWQRERSQRGAPEFRARGAGAGHARAGAAAAPSSSVASLNAVAPAATRRRLSRVRSGPGAPCPARGGRRTASGASA